MAKEAIKPESASDTQAETQDSTRRTATDAKIEIDRFHAILSERLSIQFGRLYINLPFQSKTKAYPLSPKQAKNDPVRAWAMERYADLHPDAREPLIRSYDAARLRIEREVEIPEDAQAEPEAEPEERPRDRKGRRAQQYAGIIQSVEELKDYAVAAREIGIQYARVPHTQDNPAFTGVWRLDPEKPYRLLDCAIYFTDINRPHAASKSADYSGSLVAVNAQGERKEIQFSRDDLEDKGLDAKLIAFADWPHLPTQKYWLLEALKHLMRDKNVSIHDQYTSLGYALHPEMGLVWIANNGLETAQGFIPSEQAPFIAPALLSPGNGYRALPEVPELNEEIWVLLLEQLNPDNWARLYAKLGAAMRVSFPEGTVERAGKLDFVIETVGDGSGQGKSSEDNFILSLFGADFPYNRPPLISTDDTAPSRPRLMEAMRYLPFMTEDRKAREGNPQFYKQHETRKKLIEMYADNTGGGVKMSAYGRSMASRGNPQGLPLLTGNFDHSAYALRSDAGEEEATEWRACTFVLAPNEKADDGVSRAIGSRRNELTAWGTRERQWMMQQYNQDAHAFMLRVQSWYAQAEKLVLVTCPVWVHSRHKDACIDMVWGMIARQAFLQDLYSDSYQDHFLWNWIETLTPAFIEDRHARADYLQEQVNSRQDAGNLSDFVLDTLRYALGTSQYYIASQQETFLQPEDVPLSLTKLGMKLDQTLEGNEVYRPGQHGIIGYYLARKDMLAFNFAILYPMLEAAAQKQKYPLPSKRDFKKLFAETGVPIVKRDEYGDIERPYSTEKINGKAGQYITIPLHALYPIEESAQNEADEEEQLLQEVNDVKVTPIRRAEPATVGSSSRAEVNGSTQVAVLDRPGQGDVDFSVSAEDIPEEDL